MKGERFSTSKEIKKVLKPLSKGHGGLVLHMENGEHFVESGELHQLILGSTGVGKSRRCIIPQVRALIEAHLNVIIVDAKGEIHKNTACYAVENGYDIRVVDFRHFRGQCYNPLAFPKALFDAGDKGLAQEQVQEIVTNLVKEADRNVDPFWINAERSLLGGSINLLLETADKKDCTFANIRSILNQDLVSWKNDDNQNVKEGLLADIVNILPVDSIAKSLLMGYTSLTAETTRTCVLSEVLGTLAKFCTTQEAIAMTSEDGLEIHKLDTPSGKPFILYAVLPDDSSIYNTLAGLLMSQLTHRLVRLADSKYGGRLPVPVNMILEELGNIGTAISGLPFLLTASRSRGIRMTLVLQALSQLNNLYGHSNAATIISCTDIWVCFRTSDFYTLENLSRRVGMKQIKAGDIRFSQPLVSENQLMALGTGQAVILISGRTKYVEQFPDYEAMFDCAGLKHMPIPKAAQNKAYSQVKLTDLISIIAESKKPPTASLYKSKFAGGDKENG